MDLDPSQYQKFIIIRQEFEISTYKKDIKVHLLINSDGDPDPEREKVAQKKRKQLMIFIF